VIYLAGPIDGIDLKDAKGWREMAIEELTKYHLATYSPAHAFSIGETNAETADAIIEINDTALANSRAVLANLGGVTFGTPIEVWDAVKDHDIPVFAFGLSSKSIYRHKIRACASMEDALEALIEGLVYGRS
jgi:nucleoside 2-deoxyribosyltransferase